MQTYTNRRQKTTTYEYFPNQLLKKVTDPLGRETDFTYTGQGLVDTVTDPREKVTDFDYDADGNLTKATSPEGNITTFGYDDSGRRTSMTEPRGNVAGADPADFTTTYDYNNNDQLVLVTDPLEHGTGYAYDAAGNLDTVTNAETKVTNYDYYADNTIHKITDPRDAVVESTYDDNGNLDTVTTPAGVTDYGYDAANRRTSEITPHATGADPADFTWTYGYDPAGNLETQTHPTAGTTTMTYDALNRVKKVTDAFTKATDYTYDENDNLKTITDPLNRVTAYEYDNADQLDFITDANLKVTDYGYDANGNLTTQKTPLGFTTKWTYDGEGRLATEVDPRGTQPEAVEADYTTLFDYDPAGHLKTVTDPLNHATSYAYDEAGNLLTRTDANTHTTTYTYDSMDRLKTVTGPGTPSSVTGTTSYEYDDSGNLEQRTDAKTHDTTWHYDLAGRLDSKTTPIGTWTYGYDPAGNLKTTTTAAGNATPGNATDGKITRTYDPLDRLTGIGYSDTTPPVTYAYDELRLESMTDGAGTETYGYDDAGQLQTITRGAAVFDYDYDPLGNITSRTHPDGTEVTQSWDDDARPLVLTSPTAKATYGYDPAGNRTSIELGPNPGANLTTETRTYDRAGRLSDIVVKKDSNNATVASHTLTLDNVGNPTVIVRHYGVLTQVNENYTYDAADRVTKACYTSSCSQRSDYTYDALGNRLTENRVGGTGAGLITSTYDPVTDQLTSTSRPAALPVLPPIVTSYGYDDNGNQTTQSVSTGATTSYAYDLENRISTATVAGVATNYTYDGNGVRLTSTTGTGPTTSYTWDTNNPLPEMVREASGTSIRRFLNGPNGEPVTTTIPGTGNGTGLHYYHLDDLGSVRTVTDPGIITRATYSYEAFGASRTSPTNQSLNNPIGFAGEYKDPATGLYHLRARDYDTTTGRFTALDPIAQDITDPFVTEYIYVGNRPTVLTDPSGMLGGCPYNPLACIPKPPTPPNPIELIKDGIDAVLPATVGYCGAFGAGFIGYYGASACVTVTDGDFAISGSQTVGIGSPSASIAVGPIFSNACTPEALWGESDTYGGAIESKVSGGVDYSEWSSNGQNWTLFPSGGVGWSPVGFEAHQGHTETKVWNPDVPFF